MMNMRFTQFLILMTTAFLLICYTSLVGAELTNICLPSYKPYFFSESFIAKELNWVPTNTNRCGGFYYETPITEVPELNPNAIHINSEHGLLYSQHGTSESEGQITITRGGQQIIADKAYLYRDPVTDEVTIIDLKNHVVLRQPNDLVVAQNARYNVKTAEKSLCQVVYRTTIYSNPSEKPLLFTPRELTQEHCVSHLSAWGQASSALQHEKDIYEFYDASYSTCPPIENTDWKVQAKHIVLNRITGRGTATHVRLLMKGVPVFYTPYMNFPIDHRRQTGFLWPAFGGFSGYSKNGAFVKTPFYWNMAPNYDMTITPGYLQKRGFLLSDKFRYLFGNPFSLGTANSSLIPHDREFIIFQNDNKEKYQNSPNPVEQAELRRLLHASATRGSFAWTDNTRYNEHWSSDVDFNYVTDDYYLKDFGGNNINEVTRNQLLQLGELNYKSLNWNFIGRIHGYQTLHPIDGSLVPNSYTRLPQLILNGDYPNSFYGLNYFIYNDYTYFVVRHTPGVDDKDPVGNRMNIQPGISKSYITPYLFFTPRLQLSMTQYKIGDVKNYQAKNIHRTLPILDISSGLYLDREFNLFCIPFLQTLEPQLYYVYIPYRNQDKIPIFDTSNRMMSYDQLFVYNRFTGIDRIGDANQVSLGLTTRIIDQNTGDEKIRAGLGDIVYFHKKRVTLVPAQPSVIDVNRFSPISGFVTYHFDPMLSGTANVIWNQRNLQMDNQSYTLHYQPNPNNCRTFINLGYNFVRKGDIFPLTKDIDSYRNNLSQSDFSFGWQMTRDWSSVGRWTQSLSHKYFLNLLYGLQYDSCCWAVRGVFGRTFVQLNSNNVPRYNNGFYIQFALKGLGDISGADGDPTQMLINNISGYQSNFGRDF